MYMIITKVSEFVLDMSASHKHKIFIRTFIESGIEASLRKSAAFGPVAIVAVVRIASAARVWIHSRASAPFEA